MSDTTLEQTASKVFFITGASRGLGAALARAALAAGHRVVATGRNVEAVEKALGGSSDRLLVARLDVTQEAEAQAAVQKAVERFGRIDALVNNAGYALMGNIEETSAGEVAAQYETNVFGLLNVTRAALPILRAQNAGHVVNLSSVGGYRGVQGAGIYCSTKFAIEGISEALADEVAPFGIKVTIIEPGYFRTEFLSGDSVAYAATEIPAYANGMREFFEERNGKQEGDPEKLAAAVLQMVGEANPPLRLTLGRDAVTLLEAKIDSLRQGLEAWRELSESTGFPQ